MRVEGRRTLVCVLLCGLLSLAAGHAAAQAFPAKSVTLVVPFAPAGGADTLARILAPRLSAMSGQSVIVENKPGASGHICAELVANAAPDGYTLVMASTAAITEKNILRLAPVALVSAEAYTVVVNASVPVVNVRELIAYARANPGKLHFGSSDIGAASHLRASCSRPRPRSTWFMCRTRAPARRSPTCLAARSS